MSVGCIEAAGAEEAERHADAGADQGGESFPVGANGMASFAGGGGSRWRGVEVEDVVRGIGKEIEAVFGCRSEEQRLNEGGIGSGCIGDGGIGEGWCSIDQGKKEGDENEGLHFESAELMILFVGRDDQGTEVSSMAIALMDIGSNGELWKCLRVVKVIEDVKVLDGINQRG